MTSFVFVPGLKDLVLEDSVHPFSAMGVEGRLQLLLDHGKYIVLWFEF